MQTASLADGHNGQLVDTTRGTATGRPSDGALRDYVRAVVEQVDVLVPVAEIDPTEFAVYEDETSEWVGATFAAGSESWLGR